VLSARLTQNPRTENWPATCMQRNSLKLCRHMIYCLEETRSFSVAS
jgi:hypothetical protein